MSGYQADQTGNWMSNIPWKSYIRPVELPADAVVPEGLSEDGSGEENSKRVQYAVDAVSRQGGGTVQIPAGTYPISTIVLRDHVTLYVSPGAKLVSLTLEQNQHASEPLHGGVIYAEGAQDFCVTGGGIICGSGTTYTKEPETELPLAPLEEFNLYERVIAARRRIRHAKKVDRYSILYFSGCRNFSVHDIVLENSATWTFPLHRCEEAEISHLIINNHLHNGNSDGIDIAGSSRITISHCYIATGDDAIVLKSQAGEIHQIRVSDCELCSFANAVKIGTETQYDVSDIEVKNCTLFLPDGIVGGYAGIAIESADGSRIRNVRVSDIRMKGVSAPILIWLGRRKRFEKKQVGEITDITIERIEAEDVELPSAIVGCQEDRVYRVERVTLRSIHAVYRETGERLNVRQHVLEHAMGDYPEIVRVSHVYRSPHEKSSYWDLPCYGLFARHVRGLSMTDVTVTPRTGSGLPENRFVDVRRTACGAAEGSIENSKRKIKEGACKGT